MPLIDHFRPPLPPTHRWESFHAIWATTILIQLNRILPSRYVGTVHVHLGTQIEADVAEFESAGTGLAGNGSGNGVALATAAPPTATMTLPALFPDDMEVRILDEEDGARVVAVVELVSPRNKDRADARRAFAAKSAAYLERGVGLVVVDVVTTRQAHMHNELVELMGWDAVFRADEKAWMCAAAYRPTRRGETNLIDAWIHPLELGKELPQVTLALRGAGWIPLDLAASYAEARLHSRL
jgi:hypothetical protein